MSKIINGKYYALYDKYHRIFIGKKTAPFNEDYLYRAFHITLNGNDVYCVFDDLKKKAKTEFFNIPMRYAEHLNITEGDILELIHEEGTNTMLIKKSNLTKEMYYAKPEE